MGKDQWLYQETIVYEVQRKCGPEHVYSNDNGNLALSRKVLAEFRKLTADTLIWDRGERAWRRRMKHDPAGKRQADY
jgi:hypothetical protein